MIIQCALLSIALMQTFIFLGDTQVLCASNEAHDKVDPIIPPEGVPIGARITFEGYVQSAETVAGFQPDVSKAQASQQPSHPEPCSLQSL